MTRRSIIAVSIAAALAAAAFGIVVTLVPRPAVQDVPGASAPHSSENSDLGLSVQEKSIDTLRFIDAKRFSAVWPSAASIPKVEGKIVAGVVNHHFLAADLIARFFTALKSSAPDTKRIIILSPDHFHAGRGPISVHDRDYSTPDGSLASDRDIVASLVSSTSAVLEDGAMFESEHGIGALAPFIKQVFPDAKIVPIALDGSLDRGAARSFGQKLATLVDENTVIIISSDMSHYLPEATALKNDETTISEFKSFNEKFFATAKDDYVDNGVALVVLAGMFDTENIKPIFSLLDHGISSNYVSDKKSTTSYINGVWTR
ncbi:MAG: AmmeMemoRadiSam system protein B [Patescibacteria group bacterium]